MPRFRFTTTALSRNLTAPPSGGQTIVWDTETRGPGADRGNTGAGSFFVHCRVGGRQRKTTLGRINELAIADARVGAAEMVLTAGEGRDVAEERAAAEQARLSLADASAEHARALRRKHTSARP